MTATINSCKWVHIHILLDFISILSCCGNFRQFSQAAAAFLYKRATRLIGVLGKERSWFCVKNHELSFAELPKLPFLKKLSFLFPGNWER
jgi:hypothetical protein